MSVAYYTALKEALPNFDPGVNGKALARVGDALDNLARDNGTPPLMSFFSVSPDDIRAFAEDADVSLPQEQWHSAKDGLTTVLQILQLVENSTLARKQEVLADLEEFRKVLAKAAEHGIDWHLAIDY